MHSDIPTWYMQSQTKDLVCATPEFNLKDSLVIWLLWSSKYFSVYLIHFSVSVTNTGNGRI